MKSSKRADKHLEETYAARYETALCPLAGALTNYVVDLLQGQPRIDRVSARAKDPASFLKKAKSVVDGKLKYDDPLSQIQDQVGARIVTFYKSDVDRIDAIVKQYFKAIEFKDRVPDSEWEFGYFGRHYVLVLPTDVQTGDMERKHVPDFFELQIKTLFQHAWSEAEHDLGYKPGLLPLSGDEKRKLAYTSAQAWGADQIFEELFHSRNTAKH